MIHIEHCKTGGDGIGGDTLAVLKRGGVRDDDGQAAFEGLLAVVVVLGSWVERGNAATDVRHFGTVDEVVPDFGSERKRLSARYALLITYSCFHKLQYIFRFFTVPFSFCSSPFTADGMDFGMVFGIEFALADSTLMHGALHGFPLFLGDFEFVDAPDVVDVTICHPRVHRHAAMGLERDSSYTGHFAGLGVEGAVRAARTTTFPKSYQQHFSTSSLRLISDKLSPIVSISDARISAS